MRAAESVDGAVPPALASLEARADRHLLLARVAGDIGHELKNPIHASVINLELVRKRIADGQGEDALQRLEVVRDQVRRVHGVVEGLLKLLRETHEPEGLRELDGVVEVVLPLLRAQANAAALALEWIPAGPGALCRVSGECLGHALVGLVAQAAAVARRGAAGSLRVEASASPCGVRVSALEGAAAGVAVAPAAAALADIVGRIARSGGMAIEEGTESDGVSWSRTVVLTESADA
jgi:signal transduction histidine kinase